MENNDLLIPFIKPARVGNFKVWRSRHVLKSGKEKSDVECVCVSNIDGSWLVRIPSTMNMFGTVVNGYATVDEQMRENFLGMLFTNMYNISTHSSEALHDAFFILSEMLTFPYLLLSEKEMKERIEKGMKELGVEKSRRKEHIGKMCEYRKQLYELMEQKKARVLEDYERQQALQREYARVSEADDLNRDEIAEQAMDILNNEESDE